MNENVRIDLKGDKFYYKDKARTILHRMDGPAIEYLLVLATKCGMLMVCLFSQQMVMETC